VGGGRGVCLAAGGGCAVCVLGDRPGRLQKGHRSQSCEEGREGWWAGPDRPGEFPGYGPVPASVARGLAADGTWVRWVTDPTTGALLDAGRRTYRPSVALREFIKARDVYCRFPTCSARADGFTTDLDHADPFHHPDPDVGPGTTRRNLGPACRKHHAIKTAGLWSITDSHTDGSCGWISPTGHKYPHHPAELGTLPMFTALEFQLHHALCA